LRGGLTQALGIIVDWRFIDNAEGAKARVLAVLYLCRERYQLSAGEAGKRLCESFGGAAYCEELMAEVSRYLESGEVISMKPVCSSEQAGSYLVELLSSYKASSQLGIVGWTRRALRRYQTRKWKGYPNGIDGKLVRRDA
jgi:hypothetical protein